MTHISIADMVARAKRAGLTMKQVCQEAEVAESTVSRARSGADMKTGTFNKLIGIIERHESAISAGGR